MSERYQPMEQGDNTKIERLIEALAEGQKRSPEAQQAGKSAELALIEEDLTERT